MTRAAAVRGRRGRGIDVRPGSIREARAGARLTMAQLAGDELTRGAIYLFESGRSRPSREALDLIAARTGRPLSFFVESIGQAAAASGVARVECALAAGRAAEALEVARLLLETPGAPATEARLRVLAARASTAAGRPEVALLDAREARRLAPDPALEAEARLAETEAMERAGDPGALAEATSLLREVGDRAPWLAGQVHHLLGTVHARRGDWAAAAECFEAAGRPGPAAALAGAADAQEAEARRWAERGSPAEAAGAYWRAAASRAAHRRLALAVESALELGRALWGMGDGARAHRALEDAAATATTLGLPAHRSRALLGLADLAMRQDRLAEAGTHAAGAEADARESGDGRALGLAHLLRGRLAARSGDDDAADAQFRLALSELEAAADTGRLIEAHGAYAELLERLGRLGEAVHHWKLAAALALPPATFERLSV